MHGFVLQWKCYMLYVVYVVNVIELYDFQSR